MRKRNRWLLTLGLAFTLLNAPALAMGVTLYVDDGGNDDTGANTCTVQASPCKTISYAMSKITTDGSAGSPHVINIAAGTYSAGVPFAGEVYPINVLWDYVSFVGADPTTTEIVGTGIGYIFSVTATGLNVQNIKLSSAGTAVNISDGEGGCTFSNNIFADTVGTGVYGAVYPPVASTSVTIAPVSFTDNTFDSTDYGVDFKLGLTFDGTTAGLTGTIGSITVTGNTFNCDSDGFLLEDVYIVSMASGTATVGDITFTGNSFNDCSSGLDLDYLYVEDMDSSTVTWGNVTVDENTFTNNNNGIDFYGWFGYFGKDLVNTSVTVGNVSVSNNTLTDNTSTAIYIDYYDAQYLSGTSTVTLGDLTVHNNTIEADGAPPDGQGIYIYDIGYIQELYDSASVTTGTIAITDNSVESDDEALYVYNDGAYYIGTLGDADTAAVNFGATTISGNVLSSTGDMAAYLDISYLGYEQYADTTVDVGPLTMHNNEMTATGGDDALYFYYYYESGYIMYDEAELSIAGLTFTDNTITSTGNYGAYVDVTDLGNDMNDSAKVTVGPATFTGNTISGDYEALNLYFSSVGYDMHDSSVLTMFPWTIDDNILTSGDGASYAALTIYYYSGKVGATMTGNASATLPDWIITNNTIDVAGGDNGIYHFTYGNPNNISNNVAVHFGSFLVDNNTLNSNKDAGMARGIDFWLEDVCDSCFNSTTFSHGDITVSNNTIYNAEFIGINLDYEDVGYYLDDAGIFTMGDVTISSNTIDSAQYGIVTEYDWQFSDIVNSAAVTLGSLDISGNTISNITAVGDGVQVDFNAVPQLLDPTASLTIGQTTIGDNILTAAPVSPDSVGIWMNGDIANGVVFAAPEVNGNSVSGFTLGLGFDDLPQASMRCNTLENNSEAGLFFISDGNFTATSNSIVGNGLGLKIGATDHAVVMAEKNWWGDAAGPVACAACNKIDVGLGTVDYDPWLTYLPSPLCGGAKFAWPMFLPAIIGHK